MVGEGVEGSNAGRHSIGRLQEIAGQTAQIAMQPSPLEVSEAQRCNVVEDCSVELPLPQHFAFWRDRVRGLYCAISHTHGAKELKMSVNQSGQTA